MSETNITRDHHQLSAGSDRISNLPGDVIYQILSCLPIHDAARTSILSTHWRHYWTFIPALNFNPRFLKSWNGYCSLEPVIDRTLMFHIGPIKKFNLRNPNFATDDAIDSWLKFLLNHHVHDLQVLELRRENPRFRLFDHFFSFSHLTHLCLSTFAMKTPPGFKGFNRLVSLDLEHIQIEFEDLNRFLSGCPRLEFLRIFKSMNSFGHINIHAPKLKCFKFAGRFCTIYLDAVGLEELSIDYRDFDSVNANVFLRSGRVEAGGNLIAAFGRLPSVTKLELDGFALEFLSMFSIPYDLIKLGSLTEIRMLCDLDKTDHVCYAIGLIRSTPNLQSLNMLVASLDNNPKQELETLEFMKAQQECKPLIPCLKNVVFHCISGSKSEMEFVRLILLWANVLEKMVVGIRWSAASGKGARILKQLRSFQRTSPNPEVNMKISNTWLVATH